MLQRGRKSSAVDLALPRVDGAPPRLKPPSYLRNRERKLFREVLASVDPRHFVESDLPLLASYVQATILAQQAVRDPDQIAVWEKAVRVQAVLATKLRLTVQARADPKTLARRVPQSRKPAPWEI
jgi:hypothetical protein